MDYVTKSEVRVCSDPCLFQMKQSLTLRSGLLQRCYPFCIRCHVELLAASSDGLWSYTDDNCFRDSGKHHTLTFCHASNDNTQTILTSKALTYSQEEKETQGSSTPTRKPCQIKTLCICNDDVSFNTHGNISIVEKWSPG